MAADDGGGRRQRTTTAREIGRRTTTGKVGSGRRTTMALSIRDGEDDVVFESSMATDKLGDDEYVRYY
jgi:hypothetical protein